MGYKEKINEVSNQINSKNYDTAINILESIISDEPIKKVEDENYYYHIFAEAAEEWIYDAYFANSKFADDFLSKIAEKENREVRKSTPEEIKNLFFQYNINPTFDNFIYESLFSKYKEIKRNDNNSNAFYYLSRILYNITLNNSFMTFKTMRNPILKLQLSIPDIWRILNDDELKKVREERKNNALFLICEDNKGRQTSFSDFGECTIDTFQEKVQKEIERWSNSSWVILKTYYTEGRNDVAHVIIENSEHTSRWFESFVVVNNRLINIQWRVALNGDADYIYNSFLKSFGGSKNFMKDDSNPLYKIFKDKVVHELIVKSLLDQEIAKRNITASEEEVERTVSHLERAMKAISAHSPIRSRLLIKDWAALTEEDYRFLENCGYTPDDYTKVIAGTKVAFQSLSFLSLLLNRKELEEKTEQLFHDGSFGEILRVKGFFTENGCWYQINATKSELHIEPVPENRSAVIVIGCSLNEDAISMLMTGKLPEHHIL